MFRSYGVSGLIRLCRDYAYTRMFFPDARLVRWPVYVRGRAQIAFGDGLTTGRRLRIEALDGQAVPAGKILIEIGRNVQLNDDVHIAACRSLIIGDDVLIASKVFISDHNHGRFDGDAPDDAPTVRPSARPLSSKPVRIGNRVWIGEGVCILSGITVGDGSVIGANAVVTRDVPENSVVAGNPARVSRRYDLASRKWRRDLDIHPTGAVHDP